MATPAQAKAAIATKLEAAMSAESAARLASDFDTTREAIPASQVRYQLQAWVGGDTTEEDSNEIFTPSMPVKLIVHYHLGAVEAEQTYTDGRMQTVLATILDPDWWTDISSIRRIDAQPEAALDDIARVGDVVSFTVTVIVTVDLSA